MPAALTAITTSSDPGSGVGQEPSRISCGASKIAAFILWRSFRRVLRRSIAALSTLLLRLGPDEREIRQPPGNLDRCNDMEALFRVRAIVRPVLPPVDSFQRLPCDPASEPGARFPKDLRSRRIRWSVYRVQPAISDLRRSRY